MLNGPGGPLRAAQRLLALQLAVTLVAVHASLRASAAIGLPLTPVTALSPYRLLSTHFVTVLVLMAVVLVLAGFRVLRRLVIPLQCWLTVWFPLQYPFLVDGGDTLAAVLVVELLPFLLGPSPATARLARGTIRLQMSLVYLVAGATKLMVPQWRSGTALSLYARDPLEGVRSHLLVNFLSNPLVDHLLSWGTPVLECGIAFSLVGSTRYRRCALAVAIVLHTSIAIAFGYYTFQLVMLVGALLLTEPWRTGSTRTSRAKAADLAPQLLGEAGR